MELVYYRVENIVEMGKKCWLPALSPFATVFLKSFDLSMVKSWDCVVKG